MSAAFGHGCVRRAGVVASLLLVACIDGGGGRTTTETHWLGACITSAECAPLYACHCGLCMLPCTSAAECASGIDPAEVPPPDSAETLRCAALSEPALAAACVLEPAGQPDVCLPSC